MHKAHRLFPVYILASHCKHDMHCCAVQPALAQTYAGLVPPLVYLADDMVRDADPQVWWFHHMRYYFLLLAAFPGLRMLAQVCLSGSCSQTLRQVKVLLQDESQFLRVRSAKQEIMVSTRMSC